MEKTEGNDEKAIQEYEKALECDPSSFYLRKELIITLISQNKTDAARDLLEDTLKRFPEKDELELILAQIYKNENKTGNATRLAERVLKRNPENQSANYLLFTILLDDRKWPEAEKYARKIIELSDADKPDNLKKVYFLLAMEYGRVENFSEGIKYLKELQVLSADNPEIHAALGTFYEEDGKLEDALKEYEKAVGLSPFSSALYQKLGDIYNRLGKTNEAISTYEKALQINSGDYISAMNLAQLYYEKKEYQKGLKILQDCQIKDGNIYYLLGAFLVQLKKMDEAKENLKKSIQLMPKLYISYPLLIHIYGKQGKKDEAIVLLNDVSEKDLLAKDRINLLFGITYLQFKNYAEAIKYLRKAHQLNPDDDFISFQLAASYEQNKDWFRAVYYLRKTIEMNPENAEALNYLGYMFAEKGTQLNEAIFLIEKALEIEPDNGYFVDSLGWAYYKKGLIGKALEQIEKALLILQKEGEDDSVIREHLGDVYYEKGELLKAKEQWEISVSLDSTREEVKTKLKEIQNKLK
ncbi:MAG: tetratricopeptide repeat protein [Candidatus Ratteibacteria bacterium]|nr:tetratricopeptide repeat protein [Candidatus Ratteibacteria bacterium]